MLRRVYKTQRRSRKVIKTESRDDLFNETLEFMLEHQIILESDIHTDRSHNFYPLNEIEALLKRLSSYEDSYRLMENKIRVYLLTFLATVILSQGRKALDLLSEVNVKNKKIAYYESKELRGQVFNLKL